ncbi:MAG TPA: class I SAM-dependent methyltransferase [Jiangellales bacterium]|nr:class I SAM-dependent methyltransferase [Jiangellales bacterium]
MDPTLDPARGPADPDDAGELAGVSRRPVDATTTARANRRWWDRAADGYQAEHGDFLRAAGFVWCPEGLDEADARLLGDVAGLRVLEVGCGAAQCSRWLAGQGARVVGLDVSAEQLRHARRLDDRSGTALALVQGDACALPFADDSFDLACSAYGAVPFVADSALLMAEVARVLRPGGRWVFSTTHPVRWCFPDDPGPEGLVARDSYWDRRPYVEEGPAGQPLYVEHHRTLGDRVREIVAAGLSLVDLVEPEWPPDHARVWGQWSPLRGRVIPGTAVFSCRKPG